MHVNCCKCGAACEVKDGLLPEGWSHYQERFGGVFPTGPIQPICAQCRRVRFKQTPDSISTEDRKWPPSGGTSD